MIKKFTLGFLCVLALSFASCVKKTENTQPEQVLDVAPAAHQDQSDTILWGAVFALTGEQASFGKSLKEGALMALEDVHQNGGVLGKKVELLILDDQSKPEEAANILTRFATQDKVVAVIGDVASSNSLAMAPVAQSYKIPFLSPASTNPKVTQMGDYIFRICFIDPFQGTVMAKFAKNSLNANQVAILRDIKSDYSMGLSDYFAKTFQELGGTVLSDQSYSAGDVDFKSQITSIKAKNPQAVFVPGYYNEVALIARQAQELGLEVPLLGGDGWDSAKLVEIGGSAMNGHYFSNHYSPDDPNPLTQSFVSRYKAKYNIAPDAMAALGYDSILVMADAINRAGTTQAQNIRDALATTKNVSGVAGVVTMNPERNVDKSAVVLKIQDGQFVFDSKVEP